MLEHPEGGLRNSGPSGVNVPNASTIGQANLADQSAAMQQIPSWMSQLEPQFSGLELGNINSMLYGTPASGSVAAQPGLIAAYQNLQPTINQMTTQQRQAGITDVANLAPAAMAATRAGNPGGAGLVDTATAQAQQRLNLQGALDPFTKTMLNQDIRGAQSARGFGTGTNDAAAEAYYQDATRNSRYQQSLGNASGAASMSQGFYGDPFSRILGMPTSGVPTASGIIGGATSTGQLGLGNAYSLFNPNTGPALSLAQQQSNLWWQKSQADSANSQAYTKMAVSGVGSLLGGMAGGM
jgi:hypothetical protein